MKSENSRGSGNPKIVVKSSGRAIDLGDPLRNLIIESEKDQKCLELEINYHDAEMEQPSTILTNLEKIGVINWLAPQFKCPSWTLPLAQLSRKKSEKDLWYLLMDPYKFVKITCSADSFLSTRIHKDDSTIRSVLNCFIPLGVQTTFGYASMIFNHFHGGSDVKAINLRREFCDCSKEKTVNGPYLSPALYDFLQKKVWYPRSEVKACGTLLETIDNVSFNREESQKGADLTHYLFDDNGCLCKTVKSSLFVQFFSKEQVNLDAVSGIETFLRSIRFEKEEKKFRRLLLKARYVVITSSGTCECSLEFNVLSSAGFQEEDRKNVFEALLNQIIIRAASGLEQISSPKDLLNQLFPQDDHDMSISFSESIYDFPVFESQSKLQNTKLVEKTFGPYRGKLNGEQTLDQLRSSDSLSLLKLQEV